MRHFLRIAAFSAITLLTCAVPASCQTAQSLSFVKKLYNDLLGAPPTSNELYSYALLLDMQSIQPEAVSAILTGTKTYRQKQVAHFYQLYLSRPATAFDLDYWVNGPGASGKNLEATTPLVPHRKKPKTGGDVSAQADRSGRLSRKGRATVTPAAPRRKARRLESGRMRSGLFGVSGPLGLMAWPPRATGTRDCVPGK